VQAAKRRKQPLRVLVALEDPELGEAFREALREWGASAQCARTLHEAIAACAQPFELLVVDAQLPDGSGVALAELAGRMRPAPLVLAVTSRTAAREAFRMAQLGAVAHLQKPATVAELTTTVEQILSRPPEFMPHLIAAVGRVNFREVLDRVRRAMAEQALAMAGGNKTGAARLLGITRQAVQQLIRDLDLSDGSQRPLYDSLPPAVDSVEEARGSEPELSRVQ
jgi:DNA-binding NtrC family response regulator